MSITFTIEAQSGDRAPALDVHDATSLNARHHSGHVLRPVLRIGPDWSATIAAAHDGSAGEWA